MAARASPARCPGLAPATRAVRPCRAQLRGLTVRAAAHSVCVLPGDGIGPEIMAVATRVLSAAGAAEGESFQYTEALIGGAAIDATGDPYPPATEAACKASDAVLLSAIGGWVVGGWVGEGHARCSSSSSSHSVSSTRVRLPAAGSAHPPHTPSPVPPRIRPPQLQVGHPAQRAAPREGPAAPARLTQRVCKPAPSGGAAAAGRRIHPQARGESAAWAGSAPAGTRVAAAGGTGAAAGSGEPALLQADLRAPSPRMFALLRWWRGWTSSSCASWWAASTLASRGWVGGCVRAHKHVGASGTTPSPPCARLEPVRVLAQSCC